MTQDHVALISHDTLSFINLEICQLENIITTIDKHKIVKETGDCYTTEIISENRSR